MIQTCRTPTLQLMNHPKEEKIKTTRYNWTILLNWIGISNRYYLSFDQGSNKQSIILVPSWTRLISP